MGKHGVSGGTIKSNKSRSSDGSIRRDEKKDADYEDDDMQKYIYINNTVISEDEKSYVATLPCRELQIMAMMLNYKDYL